MPNDHPEKIHNLTGVNDPFEDPSAADLVIETHHSSEQESIRMLYDYIVNVLKSNNAKD